MQKAYADDGYSAAAAEEPDDDPQTKFYKQHMKRDRPPPPTGSTPIYDFDEWSKAHYGANFTRRQTARKRYERIKREHGDTQVRRIEFTVLFILGFVCFLVVYSKLDQSSYDIVKGPSAGEENHKSLDETTPTPPGNQRGTAK